MKFLITFWFAVLLAVTALGQSTNKTPILRGILQGNLDGNSYAITNVVVSNATYYGNGAGITNITAPSAGSNLTLFQLTTTNGIFDLGPTTNRPLWVGFGGLLTNGAITAGAAITITTNNNSANVAVTTNVYVLRNETGGETNTGTAAFATASANTLTVTNGIVDAGPTTNRFAYIGNAGVITNGTVSAGSGTTAATNNNGVAIAVATNVYVTTANGSASNMTIYGTVDGYNTPALIIHPPTNNINSAAINIYGHGSTAASIINYQNDTSHAAADLGLWGNSFGKPYGGNFALDLYDYLGLGSNNVFGPGFQIAPTGKYQTLLGDSGTVSHPIFRASSSNLTVTFMRAIVDDREGAPAGVFDGITGYFLNWTNVVGASKAGAATSGAGTISITGTSTNVVGSGTSFLTNVYRGAKIYNGGTLIGYVNKITDDTHLSVEVATTSGSVSYTIQNPSHTFGSLGGPVGAWDSDGNIFLHGDGSNPSIRIGAGGVSGGWGWSGGNFGFFLDSGGLPFFIASTAANNSLNVDAFSTVNATYAFASPTVTATTVVSTNTTAVQNMTASGFVTQRTNQFTIAATGWTNTQTFNCVALVGATAATVTYSDGTNTIRTFTGITQELQLPMHPSYKITAASGLTGVAIAQ